LSSVLGSPKGAGTQGSASTPEEARRSIVHSVTSFVSAWFQGDASAMVKCLHPDYVHRLVAIDGRGEPPGELLRSAVGVQGQFGSLQAPDRRQQEVRILDVRTNSASAVALMGDWVLQIHLARFGGQWSIVNAMWEMA
jgi:hypothetical protein